MPRPRPIAVLVFLAALFAGPAVRGDSSSGQGMPALTTSDPPPSAAARADATQALLDQASEYGYNLDYQQATAIVRRAIHQDPDSAAAHNALASSMWLRILFLRGAVTTDHYLGGFRKADVDAPKPPPELDAGFREEVKKAEEIAFRRVAANPDDAQAHYELGTAYGLQASYMASVEGRLLAGLKAARRSFDEEERVLELDPRRKDAGLIVGTYRYIVSTLSLPLRFMAYIVGFGGGKERGLRLIEEAAAYPGDNQPDAQFALILLYNREKRYGDAMTVLRRLYERYPRNRLTLLEWGSTALRGGRPEEADRLLTKGLDLFAHDSREKIPGELGLWHYKRGAARVALGRKDAALADLAIATGPDSVSWVQGRAHVELARLAARQKDRETVRKEVAAAIALCEKDDPICVDDAKHVK